MINKQKIDAIVWDKKSFCFFTFIDLQNFLNSFYLKKFLNSVFSINYLREVYVVRLISSGTIEEEMLTIAQKKLQLEKEITGGNINGTKFVSLHEEGKSYLLIIFIRKTHS